MPGQYPCPVCGQSSSTGTGNTVINQPWCKSCDNTLRAVYPMGTDDQYKADSQMAHTVTRNTFAIMIYNSKEPMEVLSMCISWLNRASPSCDSNPAFTPAAGLQEPPAYKKTDFDPDSSPPFDIQGHRHSQLLYISALAAFRVYGSCQFALSLLRTAHQANKQVLPFLLGAPSTISKESLAAGFHSSYKPTWAEVPGALDWLRASAEDIRRRPCDGIGCKKVEDSPKIFKACGRCRVTYYCGVECQTADWKEGYHRVWCRKKSSR